MGVGHSRQGPSRRCGLSWRLLLLLLVPAVFVSALAVSPATRALAQDEEVWLLVDTGALTLSVMRGERLLHRYDNIAIGSNGPTLDKKALDETTPLGDYHINDIRPSKRFHIFLAIDYPTLGQAYRAAVNGRISLDDYRAMLETWNEQGVLPQNTPLGGYLGIHGLGSGSVEIHREVNWTNGCIALTNEEVDDLVGRVTVGTRVSIR